MTDIYSKLYAWDATDSRSVTLGTVPTDANKATASDFLNHASYACRRCPNSNEISWYLSVPCYWDSGNITGGNTNNYKMADGNYTKAGMWFRKSSGISSFSSTGAYTTTLPYTRTPTALTNVNVPANLKSDYFFLPAAGSTDGSGKFGNGGVTGNYWSSTPILDTGLTHGLNFSSTAATFNYGDIRSNGYCLWQKQ